MAYELKELGWYDEDIKSISSSISGQVMTITITLQNGNTLDTTVTLPEATGAKVTSISNAIVDNKLTTTVTLSDGSSVTSEAVDLPTVNISGKQDKEINLTGFTAKTVEGALTEAKAAGETASTNLTAHIGNKENPHGVTAAQVGLGNVNNTSDNDKPVSTAQQTALDAKLDKVKTTTPNPQVYAKNADGTQGMLNVGGTAGDDLPNISQINRAFDALFATVGEAVSGCERTDNKVTEVTGEGSDVQYPSTSALVKYVAANAQSAYRLEVPSLPYVVSQDEYNKLIADKNSYIIDNGDNRTFRYSHPEDNGDGELIYYFGEQLQISSDGDTQLRMLRLSPNRQLIVVATRLQSVANKTYTLSSSSTDTQYPTAKAVVDYTTTAIANAITTALNTPV